MTVLPVDRYDKSLHSGRGDRAPKSSWPEVSSGIGSITDPFMFSKIWHMVDAPADIIILEGWMLGFQADCCEEDALPRDLQVSCIV